MSRWCPNHPQSIPTSWLKHVQIKSKTCFVARRAIAYGCYFSQYMRLNPMIDQCARIFVWNSGEKQGTSEKTSEPHRRGRARKQGGRRKQGANGAMRSTVERRALTSEINQHFVKVFCNFSSKKFQIQNTLSNSSCVLPILMRTSRKFMNIWELYTKSRKVQYHLPNFDGEGRRVRNIFEESTNPHGLRDTWSRIAVPRGIKLPGFSGCVAKNFSRCELAISAPEAFS